MGQNAQDKKSIADDSLNYKILTLLKLVTKSPTLTFKENKSSAKLFELKMLSNILACYKRVGSISVKNASGGILYLAGSPASANKKKFSYFELYKGNRLEYEVWISVQFITLSYNLKLKCNGLSISNVPLSKIPHSAMHEIDVGIFRPTPDDNYYPSHESLCAGFSCKHLKPTKECVREALGFRRETGFLSRDKPSSVSWFKPHLVPSKPPSPIYLASSSANVLNYRDPVELIGVYMLYASFYA